MSGPNRIAQLLSQDSVLRTIEDIFGTEHINLNTNYAWPIADAFDIKSSGKWTLQRRRIDRSEGRLPV